MNTTAELLLRLIRAVLMVAVIGFALPAGAAGCSGSACCNASAEGADCADRMPQSARGACAAFCTATSVAVWVAPVFATSPQAVWFAGHALHLDGLMAVPLDRPPRFRAQMI